MKRKTGKVGLMVGVLLMSMALMVNLPIVKAGRTIYIRADGSIDPPTANITSADNVTYYFTDNNYDSIVVERDNIVIDGAGCTVEGTGSGIGIDLAGRTNVTVRNATVSNFSHGIYLRSQSKVAIIFNNLTANKLDGIRLGEYSNDNTISGNNIANNYYGIRLGHYSNNNSIICNNVTASNFYGIWLYNSSDNRICGNNVTATYIYIGIRLDESSNNSISGNNVVDNKGGIWLRYSSNNNSIVGNNVTANDYAGIGVGYSSNNNSIICNNITANNEGIFLYGSSNYSIITGNSFVDNGLLIYDSYENAVSDNLVNGKPLVYLDGVSDTVVEDAGQVVLVRCDRIRVENLNLSNATVGVELWQTSNSEICGNNLTNNEYGVFFWGYGGSSSNNIISRNNITNNWNGVRLWWFSSNNSINRNNIANNDYDGISLIFDSVNNNSISGNNIAENKNSGIWFYNSSYNCISENNIEDNNIGVRLTSSSHNSIYHNNFIDNNQQTYVETPSFLNSWDNGYPSGGNYWSNYIGEDLFHGPNQEALGSDGIGDTPYIIDENNQDNYPLVIHDIAVTDVSPSKTVVGQGYSLNITVTVANQGDFTETFRVSVLYGDLVIPTAEQWDEFWSRGDVNRDGFVDQTDSQLLGAAFGSHEGDPNWDSRCDLNHDGAVDAFDMAIFAANYGSNIWTYFELGTPPIGTQWVDNLPEGDSTTITFTWNTAGFAYSTYTITACAWSVPGERDTADNTLTDGWVPVTIPGDVDGDFDVDILDIVQMAIRYCSRVGDPQYDPNCDIDGDGHIGILDIVLGCIHYGQRDP